jgi:hypothetical protein
LQLEATMKRAKTENEELGKFAAPSFTMPLLPSSPLPSHSTAPPALTLSAPTTTIAIHPTPQPQPTTYSFSPILHANASLHTHHPIVQRFYRQTVQQTLDELLNSTVSSDVSHVVHAYWAHVQDEVPALEEGR